MRLTRWWSSSTCEGLSSGLTQGPLNAVRPFPDEDSALFPSSPIRRKTASRASMRKSAPLRRGERDCDIGLPLGCCYTGDLRVALEESGHFFSGPNVKALSVVMSPLNWKDFKPLIALASIVSSMVGVTPLCF